MIVSTLTMFVGFAIVVAAWTSVPEVTRAPGEITPTDDFRQIEAPELGTVVSVRAREGDSVVEGQVLATLSSVELSQQILTLDAEIESLRRQQRNHGFILEALKNETIGPSTPASDAEVLSYAMSTLSVFNAQRESDLDTIERLAVDVERYVTALKRLRRKAVEKTIQVEETQSLFEKGLSTRARLTASEDALSAINDQIHAMVLNLSSTEKDLAILKAKLTNDRLALREKYVERQFEVEQQLALTEAERQTLKNRIAALKIVAPMDGRIHSVGFPNRGEIIERGEQLFELLPTGEALVAVLRLPTRDIGHITTGMAVKMRLETFDARTTQPLVGEIKSISPNRVFDRDLGEDYFRATVELDQDSPSFAALRERLSAGMALTAEVVTRERSMLAYILKPIERSFSTAFSER
ncbi:MAG: HlyD family type I secretion periplasmic adaptor subunit [Pseudomonadota bacterium]